MKHSRREFFKISGGALGAMAVPSEAVKASAQEAAAIVEMDASGGSVSVSPVEGVAGEHGTWTVSYRVGSKGIKQHGGVRVQLPDSWHAGIRNSANRLQSSNPRGENYISSECSRAGVHQIGRASCRERV